MPLYADAVRILEAVSHAQHAAGEVVAQGASDSVLEAANEHVRREFGLPIPQSYVSILKQRDGIDYNGTVFYSALDTPEKPGPGGFWQGIVAANQMWRDDKTRTDLLILGDSSMDFFAFSPKDNSFGRYDRVTSDVIERYQDAHEMIMSALKD
jgi:hypothetical protein